MVFKNRAKMNNNQLMEVLLVALFVLIHKIILRTNVQHVNVVLCAYSYNCEDNFLSSISWKFSSTFQHHQPNFTNYMLFLLTTKYSKLKIHSRKIDTSHKCL